MAGEDGGFHCSIGGFGLYSLTMGPETTAEIVNMFAQLKREINTPSFSRLADNLSIELISGMGSPQVMADPLGAFIGLSPNARLVASRGAAEALAAL